MHFSRFTCVPPSDPISSSPFRPCSTSLSWFAIENGKRFHCDTKSALGISLITSYQLWRQPLGALFKHVQTPCLSVPLSGTMKSPSSSTVSGGSSFCKRRKGVGGRVWKPGALCKSAALHGKSNAQHDTEFFTFDPHSALAHSNTSGAFQGVVNDSVFRTWGGPNDWRRRILIQWTSHLMLCGVQF